MGSISLLIILANVIVSYRGFKDHEFFARYSFEVEKILLYRDYKRLVTSGFLHVNWMHLLFNMFSLYMFSASLEFSIGPLAYLFIYFCSLIGGNLFTLLMHRKDSGYSSVGASGAVCGLIFASIALFPGMGVSFFFLPISIPSWFYGLVFVGISIYGIHSKRDNVGHETHLAGALIGMLMAIALYPQTLRYNYLPILALLLPSALFIYLIARHPHVLLVNNLYFKRQQRFHSIEDRYNTQKLDQQKTIDAILEKIHHKGMSSLTKKERELLSQYSKTVK